MTVVFFQSAIKKVVAPIGAAGQLSEFPNAVLYIQKEELKQIDFYLDVST